MGIDQLETVREAASYVDPYSCAAQIRRTFQCSYPTKFSLVVNLKTAKGLGLSRLGNSFCCSPTKSSNRDQMSAF